MTFDEYQEIAETTAMYPLSYKVIYPTLGLAGEAGEVAEKIKKRIRDDTKVSPDAILSELGDVLFYTTALANYYNFNLASVIAQNMFKLDGRETRGTIKGSGDER